MHCSRSARTGAMCLALRPAAPASRRQVHNIAKKFVSTSRQDAGAPTCSLLGPSSHLFQDLPIFRSSPHLPILGSSDLLLIPSAIHSSIHPTLHSYADPSS